MLKKILATIGTISVLSTLLPATVVAAGFEFVSYDFESAIFDPAKNNGDEWEVSYEMTEKPDSVTLKIENEHGKTVYEKSSSAQNYTFEWDGIFSLDYVEPGDYDVELTASKSGNSNAVVTGQVEIKYSEIDRPTIENLTLSSSSFDPEYEETTISFLNRQDAELTVEIRDGNGNVYRTFKNYDGDTFDNGETHELDWDGRDNFDDELSVGTYLVVVVARNENGVDKESITVKIDDDGDVSSSNEHIDDFDLNPEKTFQPDEDDELEIQFDVRKDLDELSVWAVKGSTSYEIERDKNVDSESNYEVTWDGELDDNDEYAEEGTWKIEVRTKLGSVQRTAVQTIKIEYEEPEITELFLSKDEIDPDEDEFLYIIFRVDADAEVDINVLDDGDEEDEIEEEMDVEEDRWYAVKWDGDNYDEDDDDIEIELIARNRVNEDIEDSETVDVDFEDESDTASNKANIIGDYIDPVIAEPGESLEISYYLDDDADVKITIHEGRNGSGKELITLIDIDDQEEGRHTVRWNGRDDDGDRLDDDEDYSYKITSRKGATETEVGVFVIGTEGDDRYDDDDDDDDDDRGGSVAPGVSVDGHSGGSGDDDDDDDFDDCGFRDVSTSSRYCAAANWAKEEGVFSGYADGSFRPYSPINRAEALTVVLKAAGIDTSSYSGTNAGFSDVYANAWYMPAIEEAFLRGIFDGDAGKSTARPNENVNRAEALKFLGEAYLEMGERIGSCTIRYADVPVNAWYAKYICLEGEGRGFEMFGAVTILSPGRYVTRGEMVEALYQIFR